MAGIGDLIVKLKLNGSEFKKGLDKAGKDMGKAFKNMKAGAMALRTGAVAAAVKTFDEICHLSQNLGDEWDRTVFKMKSTWSTFWRIDATGEYKNFFSKFKTAVKEAGNLFDARDDQFEANAGMALFKAENQQELNKMLVVMRDQTKSVEERTDAAEKYLAKLKEIKSLEIANAKILADQEVSTWLANVGKSGAYSTDQIYEYVKYLSNPHFRTLINGDLSDNGTNLQELRDLLDVFKSSLSAEQMRDIRAAWGANNDDSSNPVVKALERYRALLGSFDGETTRVQTLVNSLTAKEEKAAEKAAASLGGGSKSTRDSYLDVIADDNYARASDEEFQQGFERAQQMLEIFQDIPAYKDAVVALCEELATLNELTEDMPGPDDIEIPLDTSVIDEFQANVQRFENLMLDFRDACIDGFASGMQVLMDGLFGLEDLNAGKIFAALLSPLADMAVREGEILIAQGIGVEACKKALESLNGVAAIAAGASLVAIGTAAKAGLSKLASSGSASASSSGVSASSSSADTQIDSSLTIYVKGSISGSDIVISGSKTIDKWNR